MERAATQDGGELCWGNLRTFNHHSPRHHQGAPAKSPSFHLPHYLSGTPPNLNPCAPVPPARSYLQSFPKVLLSSALWRCGYWSASFLRAACAQTMKAFMGRLTWGLLLLLPLTRTGMGTRVQS